MDGACRVPHPSHRTSVEVLQDEGGLRVMYSLLQCHLCEVSAVCSMVARMHAGLDGSELLWYLQCALLYHHVAIVPTPKRPRYLNPAGYYLAALNRLFRGVRATRQRSVFLCCHIACMAMCASS
eukprot:TRINITY_DN7632_c0_g1_i1.p1 TRINITY_DN7632_c0_g1~~TRINITY_DN7632_c0_g1_i1.p1  ORF type:complete len:124 (-),score=1.25 TRINITY_DN7632_c0_g1_i1:204-575(-)